MVQGFKIPDGMVFVGTELSEVKPGGEMPDPCLINPRLPVSGLREGMGYWPSYSQISPGDRRTYLQWLSGGRKDPAVDLGYVFLFFYGLERRILFDWRIGGVPRGEVGLLGEELKRVRSIYADGSSSFDRYSNSLLMILKALQYDGNPKGLLPDASPGKRTRAGTEAMDLGLSALTSDGENLDGQWAFQWYLHMNEVRLKKAPQRCPEMFRRAFLGRFEEKYPEGLKLATEDREYQIRRSPASAGLRREDMTRIPVPGLKQFKPGRQRSKVKKIGDQAQELISGYGLKLGRGIDASDPWALAELPLELASEQLGNGFISWVSALRIRMEDGTPVAFPLKALHRFFPPAAPPNYGKTEAKGLASFFRSAGIALEPDPNVGGPNPSTSGFWAAYPFRKGRTPETSPAFEAATTVLHLAIAVAHADGSVDANEAEALENHIRSSLKLPAAQERRLDAHITWLLAAPPKLSGLRERLAALTPQQRRSVAKLVLAVAGADGRVSPDEVRTITRIYDLLGIPEQELHSQLHVLASSTPPARHPVRVLEDSPAEDFLIPQSWTGSGVGSGDIVLDPTRMAEIQSETEKVFDVLKGVFENGDHEPEEPEPEGDELEADEVDQEAGLDLDTEHTRALEILLKQTNWREDDLNLALLETGLMGSGVIEVINAATIEAIGEPLFYWDDNIEVNHHAREELGL
jgi:tellurite resistance protein